jgi:hypothetical protein
LIQPNGEQLGKELQEYDSLPQVQQPREELNLMVSVLLLLLLLNYQVEDIQMEKVPRKLYNLLRHSPPKRSEDQS